MVIGEPVAAWPPDAVVVAATSSSWSPTRSSPWTSCLRSSTPQPRSGSASAAARSTPVLVRLLIILPP